MAAVADAMNQWGEEMEGQWAYIVNYAWFKYIPPHKVNVSRF